MRRQKKAIAELLNITASLKNLNAELDEKRKKALKDHCKRLLNKDDVNYVEPDISVVCDPSKLDEKGCHGAPD